MDATRKRVREDVMAIVHACFGENWKDCVFEHKHFIGILIMAFYPPSRSGIWDEGDL